MRKSGIISISILTLLLVAFTIQSAYAANPVALQEYRRQLGYKAAKGIKNILFGWTEIPKRVVDITNQSRNPFWGVAAGLYQGTCQAFARTASGVVDVATCGVKSGEGSFMQPYMIKE